MSYKSQLDSSLFLSFNFKNCHDKTINSIAAINPLINMSMATKTEPVLSGGYIKAATKKALATYRQKEDKMPAKLESILISY